METQHIEDRLMSPTCYSGQHEACKRTLSFIGEDGVSRSQICACRCHDRAPVAKTAENPTVLYLLSWEYEVRQPQPDQTICETHAEVGSCDGKGPRCVLKTLPRPDLTAWIQRRVLAVSREVAGDWLDSVAELVKTNRVRHLVVMKAPIGDWIKIDAG